MRSIARRAHERPPRRRRGRSKFAQTGVLVQLCRARTPRASGRPLNQLIPYSMRRREPRQLGICSSGGPSASARRRVGRETKRNASPGPENDGRVQCVVPDIRKNRSAREPREGQQHEAPRLAPCFPAVRRVWDGSATTAGGGVGAGASRARERRTEIASLVSPPERHQP